jgi:hypothetical protein
MKNNIYKEFDKEGILINKMFVICSININDEFEVEREKNNEVVLTPNLLKYQLNEIEALEIVLDYLFETTGIRFENLKDAYSMRTYNSKPFLVHIIKPNNCEALFLASGIIPGSITFKHFDKIDSLCTICEINGSLGLHDTDIKDLGDLKKISNDFWIGNYRTNGKILSLNKLEYVGGDFNIKGTNVVDLGNLKYIGGDCNIKETKLSSLGNLKYIGGNLLAPIEMKNVIINSTIQIKGKIRYYKNSSFDILNSLH